MNTFSAIAVPAVFVLALFNTPARAVESDQPSYTAAAIASSKYDVKWDAQLFKAPQTFPAPGVEREGAESLFYAGLPYQGKPTRVFAFIGIPKRKGNEKVPGIVLVHGGGGTAYIDWVRLWTSRGYAAIAMDHFGNVPGEQIHTSSPHEYAGPHRSGGFGQINEPIEDHWTYQAVADIILANSLLRSRPEVDANRIGITGISWGGYLTCIAAGVDNRFKFAVSVYGSGFFGDNASWTGMLRNMGDDGKKWLGLWDASRYVGRAQMPFLWVFGTNDLDFPMDSVQKTYLLPPARQRTLSTHVRMPHGHGGHGENPEEIHAFADSYVNGGAPLARIEKNELVGKVATVTYISARPIVRAELNYTKGRGSWTDRYWNTIPARVDANTRQVMAGLPSGTSVYYLSLIDDKGHLVSSEHVEVPAVP